MSDVRVISPEGESGTVPEEALQDALDVGYRLETEEDVKARAERKEYEDFGSQIAAGAAGIARGATFGLSDQLLTKTNLVESETLRKLKEYNPNLSTASELGGAIGSLLIPGVGAAKGASLLAKAGSAATTLPRAAVGAGNLAAKILTGGATGTAAKLAGAGISAATEGALFRAGQHISEEALSGGNYEKTGQDIIADIGVNALWSGSASVGLKLVGMGAKPLLRKAAEGIKAPTKEGLEEFAQKRAVESLNLTPSETRKLLGNKPDMGKFLIKHDIIKGGEIDDMAIRLKEIASTEGEKIGAFYKQLDDNLDDAARIDVNKLAQKIKKELVDPLMGDPGAAPRLSAMEKQHELFEALGKKEVKWNYTEFWKKIKSYDDQINYDSMNPGAVRKEFKKLRGLLKDELETSAKPIAEKNLGKEAFNEFKQAKLDFGHAQSAYDKVAKRIADKQGMRGFSLTDNIGGYTAGAAGLATYGFGGGLATGIATGAANKLLRERGSAYLAEGAMRLSRMESLLNAAHKTSQRTKRAIKGFIGATRKSVPPAIAIATPMETTPIPRANRPQFDTTDKGVLAYQKRLDELSKLATNPGYMSEKIAQSAGPLQDMAPNIATQMTITATNAAGFLYAKAPKFTPDPYSPNPVLDKKHWKPTQAELSQFSKYERAVANPLGVLDNITPEGVETLRMVYPALYQDIVVKVSERVAGLKDRLSYADKRKLFLLMGQPMDYSHSPEFLGKIQMSLQQQAVSPSQNMPMPKPTAQSKIPELMKTKEQRLAAF